ncbi:MAG: DUF5916 domain-containing protein [Acidobacteriota bacterium]|nr:DUF5916 domain-containing protein [Acidobacteriota bacterium]
MDEPPVVDGVLDESIWGGAEFGTGFIQREPQEMAPATEKTQFWIVYTADTLYVGVHAYDSEPTAIVAKEMERDASLYRDDSLMLVIDTFGDSRNAYAFETNPNGARFDALVTDEGRDINKEWDGVWTVASRRNTRGWVAEFAIPLSTLRFDPARSTWGLNVRRMIRHKDEEVNWAPLGRDVGSFADFSIYAVYRISLAGRLEGMETRRKSRQIDIKPFVVARATESPGTGNPETGDDAEAGLDVKWSVTRNLALDVTVNTDFAEVEIDDQQTNLTRFSLFFPEKREFFLENAGIFEFGPPQRNTFRPLPQMKVFFSRRIGLDRGHEVPIDYGVRLTGRVGGWNVGVLEVLTAETDLGDGSLIPDANYGVVRLKRNIGRRSGLGLIYTNRDTDVDTNQVYGVDFDYKPSRALAFNGFFTQSDDDRAGDGDDWAGGYGFAYSGRDMNAFFDHVKVNEEYRPDVGFLLRRNFERFNPSITYRPRIERKGIRSLFFNGEIDYFKRASTGELESRKFILGYGGLNNYREDGFGLYADFETERLFEPFEIQPGVVLPPGLYRFDSLRIGGRTNESRPLALLGRVSSGDFFSGTRDWANLTLRMRASRYFRAELTLDYNDVDLPEGSFITRVMGTKLGLSFTPDLRLNALLQYDDSAQLVGANIRFNWIYRPGADLFVVYNHGWTAPSFRARETQERQLIIKFTYLFQG